MSGSAPFLVGPGVVAGVLALPPAVADPHQQIGDDQADPVVPTAGLEDLAVRGVMAEEGYLGHEDGEHSGIGELPPGVADPDKRRHPGGEGQDGADQLGPVVAVAATHQPHLVNGAGQRRERATGLARRRGCGRRGRHRERVGWAGRPRWRRSKEVKRMAVLGNISRWCLGVSTWLARETRCENGVSGPRPTAMTVQSVYNIICVAPRAGEPMWVGARGVGPARKGCLPPGLPLPRDHTSDRHRSAPGGRRAQLRSGRVAPDADQVCSGACQLLPVSIVVTFV